MKKFNKVIAIFLFLTSTCVCVGQETKIVTHDFDDGNLAPFETCNVKSPNYVKVENQRVTTFWGESGYDGTRDDKGAEFCGHELGDWLTYKEGWCGVTIELGSDYPKNKNAGIAQIMGRFLDIEWSTWSGEISIENGDLVVQHRFGAGSSNTVHAMVYPNFPYEEEVDVIIHFILSDQNTGELEFWINGVSSYKATNINFGLGKFENNEQVPGLSRTIFKLGQYNYDDSNYDTGETRTVYYDNVTWYNGGAEGYNIVNPDKNAVSCNVVQAGIAGNSTTQMLNRMDTDVLAQNPSTTLLLAGTNDMLNSGKNITLSTFKVNLREIIENLEVANSEIILMTIPPCVEALLYERHDPNYFLPEGANGRVDLANDFIREIALEKGLLVVDMNALFANDMSLISSDGVHPTASGYSEMADLLYDAMKENCFPCGSIVCFGNSITRGYSSVFSDKVAQSPLSCDGCSDLSINQMILSEDFCEKEGGTVSDATEGGKYISTIKNGNYFKYGNINFDSDPITHVEANVAKSTTKETFIELRLDSPTGTLLGTLDVSESTGGSQNWKTYNTTLSAATGKHAMYLVFTGQENVSLINFNWFRLFEGNQCDGNVSGTIEAEDYCEMYGIQTEPCDEGGSNIGFIQDGDWAKYSSIDLSNQKSIKARVATKNAGGSIEFRLDTVDGTLLGAMDVSVTGDWQNWESDSINLNEVSGRHDVYLVFNGGTGYLFNINWFGFSEEEFIVTSVNSEIENSLEIYPNPVGSQFQILNREDGTLEIFNQNGKLELSLKITDNNFTVNINEYPKGIYLLKVSSNEDIAFRKVIKI